MPKDTLNKADIASLVFNRTGCSRTVSEKILNAVFDIILEQVSLGRRIQFNEFGSFYRVSRPQQKVRDFYRNTNMVLPERYGVVFKPATKFKDAVSQKKP